MMSSESSDDGLVCRKKRTEFVRDHVSTWNKDKILEMNIHYSDNASEITDIFQILKDEHEKKFGRGNEVPKITSKLIEILKEMDASFSLNMEKADDMDSTHFQLNMMECNQAKQKIRALHEQLSEVSDGFLLHRWMGRLFDFYNSYRMFLACCLKDKAKNLNEKSYVDLLKDFTKVFFLDPQDGKTTKSSLDIKGICVSSMPDIRYSKDHRHNNLLLSVTVAEIKNKRPKRREMIRDTTFNINTALGDSVLGQHAGELLLESFNSYFTDNKYHLLTFGMICMKTQIIFTCMRLGAIHIRKIMAGESVENEDCVITYTRPFNFMMSEDRDEIMEHLFWLGFLQQDEAE